MVLRSCFHFTVPFPSVIVARKGTTVSPDMSLLMDHLSRMPANSSKLFCVLERNGAVIWLRQFRTNTVFDSSSLFQANSGFASKLAGLQAEPP
jgi:hypothetical protein